MFFFPFCNMISLSCIYVTVKLWPFFLTSEIAWKFWDMTAINSARASVASAMLPFENPCPKKEKRFSLFLEELHTEKKWDKRISFDKEWFRARKKIQRNSWVFGYCASRSENSWRRFCKSCANHRKVAVRENKVAADSIWILVEAVSMAVYVFFFVTSQNIKNSHGCCCCCCFHFFSHLATLSVYFIIFQPSSTSSSI